MCALHDFFLTCNFFTLFFNIHYDAFGFETIAGSTIGIRSRGHMRMQTTHDGFRASCFCLVWEITQRWRNTLCSSFQRICRGEQSSRVSQATLNSVHNTRLSLQKQKQNKSEIKQAPIFFSNYSHVPTFKKKWPGIRINSRFPLAHPRIQLRNG